MRRNWVWAQLGASSLANALAHLKELSKETECIIGGDTTDAMARLYSERGYRADLSVLHALASVSSHEDKRAVVSTIRTLYHPWLEQSTVHFQQLVLKTPLTRSIIKTDAIKCCWLFVDGLRFDLAQRLKEILQSKQFVVSFQRQWAALPTVTATAKPAVSLIATVLEGRETAEDFNPVISQSGQSLTPERFKKELSASGIQIIDVDNVGDPAAEKAVGWSEWGRFDRLGHDMGAAMAGALEDQLLLLADRILELLRAGWEHVRLVTDHGWLLVPGGCPKLDLPKYLVASRWTRCAAIKETAHVEIPTAPWFWNAHERFAFAPGIHCFEKGHEFAHGGVSLQECLIPEMTIKCDKSKIPIVVKIKSVQWIGMRCRVLMDPVENIKADLRTRPNDPMSSIALPNEVDGDGNAALLVSDDSLEGTVVSLVILDASGQVVAKHTTIVGGAE